MDYTITKVDTVSTVARTTSQQKNWRKPVTYRVTRIGSDLYTGVGS